MQETPNDIIIFFVVASIIIIAMTLFVLIILFTYRNRQNAFNKEIQENKSNYEKNLLTTQLEIQEQTLNNISREIHDNIGLSLTLAKLHLNTIDWQNKRHIMEKTTSAIELLGQSINGLNNISKGLNADLIKQQGLIRAIEDEIKIIREVGLLSITFEITGNPVYLDAQNELIIFRAIQEALNNILKHANATTASLTAHYDSQSLLIVIQDNGKGFDKASLTNKRQAGIKNIQSRIQLLQGKFMLESKFGIGTIISLIIPLNNGK